MNEYIALAGEQNTIRLGTPNFSEHGGLVTRWPLFSLRELCWIFGIRLPVCKCLSLMLDSFAVKGQRFTNPR